MGLVQQSTNEIFPLMYSPWSICCCSWADTETGSCWTAFCWGERTVPIAAVAKTTVHVNTLVH